MEWFNNIALPPLSRQCTKDVPSMGILDDLIDDPIRTNIDSVCSILTDDLPTSAQPKSKEALLSTGVVFPTIAMDDFFGSVLWDDESWGRSTPSPLPTDTESTVGSDANDNTAGLLDSQKRLRGFTITIRPSSLAHKKPLYNYTDDATGCIYTSMKLAAAGRKLGKKYRGGKQRR